jgi:adenosylmethionine---8-amino-7-oxononanoate aminotransferase
MLDELREHPHVGEIRQKGLMVGIELIADKRTRARFEPNRRTGHQFCSEIRKHGVILRPLGDVIVIMPPLAIGVDDLNKIVRAVKLTLSNL